MYGSLFEIARMNCSLLAKVKQHMLIEITLYQLLLREDPLFLGVDVGLA